MANRGDRAIEVQRVVAGKRTFHVGARVKAGETVTFTFGAGGSGPDHKAETPLVEDGKEATVRVATSAGAGRVPGPGQRGAPDQHQPFGDRSRLRLHHVGRVPRRSGLQPG